MESEYDVVVVGAGPGGSCAARHAALGGASVLLLEKRQEIGTPVRCGEGFARGLMDEAGIPIDKTWIAAEMDGARIISPAGHAFEVDETSAGSEVGFVIERDLFDRAQARLAAKAGAEILVKASVIGLLKKDGNVAGVKVLHNGDRKDIKAKAVIGADGYESQVGRWAGIDTTVSPSDMMSCVQYRLTDIEPDPKYTEFYAGSAAPGGYIWVFPKSDDTANVGIGIQGSRLKHPGEVKQCLDRWIARQDKFKNGKQLDMVAGGTSACAPLDRTVADNVVLIGDAARLIDPMTGGGIGHACLSGMIGGRVVAEGIETGDTSEEFFQKYEKGWRDLLEEKLYRNWMAKEKAMTLSDETFDKLIKVLADVGMENINVFNILKVVQEKHPELIKEFEDLM